MKFSIQTSTLLMLLLLCVAACSDKKQTTDDKNLGSDEVEPVTLTGQIKDIITKANLDSVVVKDSRGTPIDTTGSLGNFTAVFQEGESRQLGFYKNGKNTLVADFIRLDNLIKVVMYMENEEGDSPETHYIRGITTQPDSTGLQDLNGIVVEEIQTRTSDTTTTNGWYALSSTVDQPDLKYFYKIISDSQRDSVIIDLVQEIRDSARVDVVLNDKVTGITIKRTLQ